MKQLSFWGSIQISAILGFIFALFFLLFFDPDSVSMSIVNVAKWTILFPTTLLIVLVSQKNAGLVGVAVFFGTVIGSSLASIIHSSNIWPIAAAIWGVMWIPPILLATLMGIFVLWWKERIW